MPPTEASHNKEHKHQEHMRAMTFKLLHRLTNPQVAVVGIHVLDILGNSEHNHRIMSQLPQVADPHRLLRQRAQNGLQ